MSLYTRVLLQSKYDLMWILQFMKVKLQNFFQKFLPQVKSHFSREGFRDSTPSGVLWWNFEVRWKFIFEGIYLWNQKIRVFPGKKLSLSFLLLVRDGVTDAKKCGHSWFFDSRTEERLHKWCPLSKESILRLHGRSLTVFRKNIENNFGGWFLSVLV